MKHLEILNDFNTLLLYIWIFDMKIKGTSTNAMNPLNYLVQSDELSHCSY